MSIMLNGSLYTSNKSDWSTPQTLFDRLDEEFRFDFDVCATRDNAKCCGYFGPDDGALTKSWEGLGTLWMNPPYGRGIRDWVAKAFEASRAGATCVCLLPVRSDTRWWHDYVMKASEIRLLTRRLTFEGAGNKAPFPAAIVVFDREFQRPRLSAFPI